MCRGSSRHGCCRRRRASLARAANCTLDCIVASGIALRRATRCPTGKLTTRDNTRHGCCRRSRPRAGARHSLCIPRVLRSVLLADRVAIGFQCLPSAAATSSRKRVFERVSQQLRQPLVVLLEQTQRAQRFDARGVARRRGELARRKCMLVDRDDGIGRVCCDRCLAGVVVSLVGEARSVKRL